MVDSQLEEIFFKYRWYLLAAILGILLILLGIVIVSRDIPFFNQDKIEILSGQDETIKVEVSGAVERPGVYSFSSGARIEDLLVTSGGLSANADREWVTRTLNRAAKLTDGKKIYIPEAGESENRNIGSQKLRGSAGQVIGVSEGLLNINTASRAELEALPGIGPVTAGKIIEGRPYSGVEELLIRKILKKSVYEENKDKLTIY